MKYLKVCLIILICVFAVITIINLIRIFNLNHKDKVYTNQIETVENEELEEHDVFSFDDEEVFEDSEE